MQKIHMLRRAKYRFGVYNKKKRNTYKRFFFIVVFTAVCVSALLLCTEKRLSSLAIRLGTSQLENEISRICNQNISEILKEHQIDTSSVITSGISQNNKNTELTADFSSINILKTELAERLTSYLAENRSMTCHIPSGALVSNDIFAGYGIDIPAKLIVSGSALVNFSDSFESAGINQTKYRLMLTVAVDARLHTVLASESKTISVDIPICEKIIVGDVPILMRGNS